jgi:DNA-binding LytR/AlgR family response regulator
MKMNCLIVDDEPLARKGLAEYVSEIEYLHLADTCESAARAQACMQSQRVDLLFLDIRMPGLSGIEFLKKLSQPPLVIFTTAHTEHAVESYELDVVDYLVKPVPFARFKKAAQKAWEIFTHRQSGTLLPDHFFVKSKGMFVKIHSEELLYAEAMQNYVILHTPERKHIVYMTFGKLEQLLPPDQFVRVHKSYCVGIRHVQAIDGNTVIIGSARIPISRTLKEESLQKIMSSRLFGRS